MRTGPHHRRIGMAAILITSFEKRTKNVPFLKSELWVYKVKTEEKSLESAENRRKLMKLKHAKTFESKNLGYNELK